MSTVMDGQNGRILSLSEFVQKEKCFQQGWEKNGAGSAGKEVRKKGTKGGTPNGDFFAWRPERGGRCLSPGDHKKRTTGLLYLVLNFLLVSFSTNLLRCRRICSLILVVHALSTRETILYYTSI